MINSSVIGVGIDLVYIPRIKHLCLTYPQRFIKKVFTEEEINYAFRKKDPYPHLACTFAVKEAFYKAWGGKIPLRFKEVMLQRTNFGPTILLKGLTKEIFLMVGGPKIHLSLSHDTDYTIAIVILTKDSG